ncbi:Hypothetical protein DHA2_153855 [Giardia duodenalis]|uniref:Uncharacterized protein n=1 Tax=Giardia intestinalis TaxID=5741 RepID=V6T949_GIAIN|nr:Hypothetical protein DHA2_153855 [Giardia intestinalis]
MKQNDDCEIPHAGVQRADRPPRGDARRIPPIAIGETVTNTFHRVLLKGWSGMPTTSHASRSPSSRTHTR